MSEEKTETPMTEVEKAESDITTNDVDEHPDDEFASLFDEEKLPEEALMGEDPEKEVEEKAAKDAEEGKKEEKVEDKEPEKEASEEDKKKAADPESKEAEKEPEKEPDYTKPPPKGYVAIQTMHEARANVDSIKRQLETANQTITLLQTQSTKAPEETDEFSDFKKLSDGEWKELVNDDIEEALLYKDKLDRYNGHQQAKSREKDLQLRNRQQVDAVISDSVEKIATNVPGIFDEGSEIQKSLFDFGVESGFNGTFLECMTNPATRIIPIGEDGKPVGKSYPLGGGAVSLVTMIHKFNESTKGNDPEKLRSEIEAKIETDLREKITQELLEKFKTETTGQSFRSISDISGGSKDELGAKKFYTEADFSKMSPEEQERVLTGM